MMNGDYGSTRYSKLSQINRDNVKNLRMVWALALGGMQDIGQNGPENELNPLIDNGFMYTSDGWGTIYKIDARDPNRGQFVWVTDPGVKHQGNTSRTRGVALWEDLVIANLPDGRVIAVKRDTGEIVWDKMMAVTNEFGNREFFDTAPMTADDKVLIANGAGDAGTRGWVAALDARTGKELWRWYVIPKPGDPGSETWKDKNNAWKTGGGGIWQTGSYDPETKLTIWGTGNPVPQYDPQARPGDNLYTDSAVALNIDTGKLAWHFQYTPNDSWDYDEIGVHMLYDTIINGQMRKVVSHFGRNGFFYSLDRTNGQVHQGRPVRQRSELDQGASIRRPANRSNTIRSWTCRSTIRWRARCAATLRSGPAQPGTAASPTSPPLTIPSSTSPTAWASKAAFHKMAQSAKFLSANGGIDRKNSEKRTIQQRPLLWLGDGVRHHQPQGHREGRDGHRDSIGRHGSRREAWCSRPSGRLGGGL